MKRSYAFVLPRYRDGIIGGAETLAGSLAKQLALRGDDIEVLTTCALDNRTWENEFDQGVYDEGGVPVRRFEVDSRDLEQWIPRQIQLSEGIPLEVEDQLIWMSESVNSRALYEYIASQKKRYDAFFFAPYLFGTTFWGSLLTPERSILIPCLHDEPNAYQEIIQSMFRQVRGCLFNALPEQELASRLYGRSFLGGEVGMGFFPIEETASLPPYFEEPFPYILYLGRKETGKNLHLGLDAFVAAKEHGTLPKELTFVIAGGGDFSDLHRDNYLGRHDIIDLGAVSIEEKERLLVHARALIQPSLNESFSIVLMECWQRKTPVIVHADCAVTRYHVETANAGMYYRDAEELRVILSLLLEQPHHAKTLGENGARYVKEKYSWSSVLDRFDAALQNIFPELE